MYKVFIDTTAVYFLKKTPDLKNIFVGKFKVIEVNKNNFEVVLTNISDLKEYNLDKLFFLTESPNTLWSFFESNYQKRIAAGGLVVNNNNDFLLIFRNNKWDLPKGHLEKFETIEQCAIREVEEECAIKELTITKPLTITYHTYIHKGVNVLKENHWFLMFYKGDTTPIPQIEEGITKVEWIPKKELSKHLNNTYGSILDVFYASEFI